MMRTHEDAFLPAHKGQERSCSETTGVSRSRWRIRGWRKSRSFSIKTPPAANTPGTCGDFKIGRYQRRRPQQCRKFRSRREFPMQSGVKRSRRPDRRDGPSPPQELVRTAGSGFRLFASRKPARAATRFPAEFEARIGCSSASGRQAAEDVGRLPGACPCGSRPGLVPGTIAIVGRTW